MRREQNKNELRKQIQKKKLDPRKVLQQTTFSIYLFIYFYSLFAITFLSGELSSAAITAHMAVWEQTVSICGSAMVK